MRRASWASAYHAAVAGQVGGIAYIPPAGGGILKRVLFSDASDAPWVYGMISSELGVAMWTTIASTAFYNTPLWKQAPIRGTVQGVRSIAGLVPGYGRVDGGYIAEPNLVVMPPNIAFAYSTVANSISEGFMQIEEFINGDEDL